MARRNRKIGRITAVDVLIVIGALAAGWLMAWMILSVPTAGAADLEIVQHGTPTAIAAKICFEDVEERPGPPSIPVCYGPGDWDIVAGEICDLKAPGSTPGALFYFSGERKFFRL